MCRKDIAHHNKEDLPHWCSEMQLQANVFLQTCEAWDYKLH